MNQIKLLATAMMLAITCPSIQPCNEPIGSNQGEESQQKLVFEKMIGTWQNSDGKNFERWTRDSNGGYQAAGFSLKGGDTSWNEQASIYKEAGKWIFENTVKGQNEGRAIKFTSSFINENSVQFSNPAHDFPTDINYTVADSNTLGAFIVGPNRQGGTDTIPFHFKRVK